MAKCQLQPGVRPEKSRVVEFPGTLTLDVMRDGP
jgi:hypothetical protein